MRWLLAGLLPALAVLPAQAKDKSAWTSRRRRAPACSPAASALPAPAAWTGPIRSSACRSATRSHLTIAYGCAATSAASAWAANSLAGHGGLCIRIQFGPDRVVGGHRLPRDSGLDYSLGGSNSIDLTLHEPVLGMSIRF
jgi:hypothetical protein